MPANPVISCSSLLCEVRNCASSARNQCKPFCSEFGLKAWASGVEALICEVCLAVAVVSSVIVVSVVTPPVLLAIVLLALVYRQIQRLYIATSRELKRCGWLWP